MVKTNHFTNVDIKVAIIMNMNNDSSGDKNKDNNQNKKVRALTQDESHNPYFHQASGWRRHASAWVKKTSRTSRQVRKRINSRKTVQRKLYSKFTHVSDFKIRDYLLGKCV